MPEPDDHRRQPWRQLSFVLTVSFTFPAALLVGYGIGWWLDKKFGTNPFFSLIFLALGFIAAVVELMRALNRLNRE